MKIPGKPPDWDNVLKNSFESMLNLAKSNEVANLLQMANSKYLYWDKFKYLTMPEGISSETA